MVVVARSAQQRTTSPTQHRFPVPRPKSLLSGEFFPVIVEAAREVVRLNRSDPPPAVRLEAAGRDSAVMRTLAGQIAQACGIRADGHHPRIYVLDRR